MKHKSVVKEKANFIKENSEKLYFLRYYKDSSMNNTVEENLISILLSDKPLKECSEYDELASALEIIDESRIDKDMDQNYALLTLFSAISYVNSVATDDKTKIELRNKLRNYSTFLNTNIKLSSNIIKIGSKTEPNKVKAKGGI